MEILLVNFAGLAIMAFCTAAFTRFLDFAMEQGNILHFWYRFILRIGQAKFDSRDNLISENGLYKMLGGCIVCFNWWIGIAPFFWMASFMPYSYCSLSFLFFGFQGLSHYFLQFQSKQLKD